MPKRSRRPHGSLPKVPERGTKITVVYFGGLARGYVRKAAGGRAIECRARVLNVSGKYTRVSVTVYRRDEGTSWVRGHDTPEANALGTVLAMTESFGQLDWRTRIGGR